jgi:hypothetical protein
MFIYVGLPHMDYFMSSDEYHYDHHKIKNRIQENRINGIRINENDNGVRSNNSDNGQDFFREQLIR